MGIAKKVKKYIMNPRLAVLYLSAKGFLDFMGDESYLKLIYRCKFSKKLNLESPTTFNEKLQWLKLHDHNPLYPRMVDKYEAKKYVAGKIGEQYITPTLGVWAHFDDIDFSRLPNQFVLKTTRDSGGIVICKDKSKWNIPAAREKIEKRLKTNFYLRGREWPYRYVKPRIIAEPYLFCHEREGVQEDLADYKVWNFNGEPQYVQYITGRNSGDCREGFYTTDWKLQKFSFHNKLTDKVKEKPACLEELLAISRKLAEGTSFVRTDFYILDDGSIRFGEITFYPMAGFECWHPNEMDRIMGEKIDLPLEK